MNTATDNGQHAVEFEMLCERYRSLLDRAAMAMTGNPHDAADLVQETLIRAYRYFHNFEKGSNFRAWILRILHNTNISAYRRRRRRNDEVAWEDVAEHGELKLKDSELDASTEPEAIVLTDLPDEEVQEALDTLSDSFREVVELADLQEHSYAEIGEKLNVPIGTVRSRLFRARQRLRALLGEYAVREGYLTTAEVAEKTAEAA